MSSDLGYWLCLPGCIPFDKNFRKFWFKIRWNWTSFQKFVSKSLVNLSRLSFFFRKFENSGYFLFYLAFLPSNDPGLGSLRWWPVTTLDAKWSETGRTCSWLPIISSTKTLGSDFLENCGMVIPNFPLVSSPCLREKFTGFYDITQNDVWVSWVNIKENFA